MEKLWTTAEVARFLGIGEPDVEQLVCEGRLSGYKLGGQFLRFRPDHVQKLKQTLQLSSIQAIPVIARQPSVYQQVLEFIYFYDFYLVSALLLAGLVVYLVLS